MEAGEGHGHGGWSHRKPNNDDTAGGNPPRTRSAEQRSTYAPSSGHDSFEASVLTVSERNLGEFMESLSDFDAERLARERMAAA